MARRRRAQPVPVHNDRHLHDDARRGQSAVLNDQERFVLTDGDGISVVEDEDGSLAVCIQSWVWAGEDPRWICCDVAGPDRAAYLTALIAALEQLGDRTC